MGLSWCLFVSLHARSAFGVEAPTFASRASSTRSVEDFVEERNTEAEPPLPRSACGESVVIWKRLSDGLNRAIIAPMAGDIAIDDDNDHDANTLQTAVLQRLRPSHEGYAYGPYAFTCDCLSAAFGDDLNDNDPVPYAERVMARPHPPDKSQFQTAVLASPRRWARRACTVRTSTEPSVSTIRRGWCRSDWFDPNPSLPMSM